ncbi:50S ribosomal protein L10 [Nocardia arthritidis]|uniref:Large ribosomal subunit protein uL10 n=2 Tax=Nocardiaceae TaxID=85025 RepID=A0A6G9YS29_9NOCA|nr:50S ribosomal protein L10 [Nocardia arthritidis]
MGSVEGPATLPAAHAGRTEAGNRSGHGPDCFCRAPERLASGAFVLSPAPESVVRRRTDHSERRRSMAKAEKVTAVAEIVEQFKSSTATVVTEYRGLPVSKLTELRRALGAEATYSVAKNTLVKRAAAEAGVEGLDDLFVGPTAITFITGEPVNAAKALKNFAKDNKALIIKGGYMDGAALSVSEVERIADLETREVLLAKLAGAMKGNLSKAAGLFNAPASQVARLAAALQEKKQAEGGAAAE